MQCAVYPCAVCSVSMFSVQCIRVQCAVYPCAVYPCAVCSVSVSSVCALSSVWGDSRAIRASKYFVDNQAINTNIRRGAAAVLVKK